MLLNLGRLRSGKAPVRPHSRGYLLKPDFVEIAEWEVPATEAELLDAIYEKYWTEETLQISREQCVDIVTSDEDGRLNFIKRFLSISQEIWASVKTDNEDVTDELREYRRSIGACFLCGV